MGYKLYHTADLSHSKIAQLSEWTFAIFCAFASSLGGWLVHYGMPPAQMIALSVLLALVGGWHFTFPYSANTQAN